MPHQPLSDIWTSTPTPTHSEYENIDFDIPPAHGAGVNSLGSNLDTANVGQFYHPSAAIDIPQQDSSYSLPGSFGSHPIRNDHLEPISFNPFMNAFPSIDVPPSPQNEGTQSPWLTARPQQSISHSFNTGLSSHRQQPSLPRRRSKYFKRQGAKDPSISYTASQSDLGPMQRWRNSPPETEPASLSAIADALKRSPRRENAGSGSVTRSPSTISQDSSSRSSRSIASSRSSRSFNIPKGPVASRRRAKGPKPRNGLKDDSGRIFQCTFCCDTFRMKYDWVRHETALHLNLEQWVCAPYGGAVVSPITGQSQCVYCNMETPTKDHLNSHHHDACHNGLAPHVFRRKDHLQQHLRRFHELEELPYIDDWKLEPPIITSRCGFCELALSSWKERSDHLAEHFRNGATIHDWKGGHGFEPAIEAQVTNALAPAVLSEEAKSLIPFSATDPHWRDHLAQICSDKGLDDGVERPQSSSIGYNNSGAQAAHNIQAQNPPAQDLNCDDYASYLALHLGRFAQRSIAQGIFPTDEMFQDESRRLVYGNKDGWDRTLADNDEWLSNFTANQPRGS